MKKSYCEKLAKDIKDTFKDLNHKSREEVSKNQFKITLFGDERGNMSIECEKGTEDQIICSLYFEKMFSATEKELNDLDKYLVDVDQKEPYSCYYNTTINDKLKHLRKKFQGKNDIQDKREGRIFCETDLYGIECNKKDILTQLSRYRHKMEKTLNKTKKLGVNFISPK